MSESILETTIYLVRHGEVYNPKRILYGRLPGFELSEHGALQAHKLGSYFSNRPICAIFSSPLLRAYQTATYVSKMHDLHIQKNDLLNEIKTPYEGWSYSKLEEMNWDIYNNIPAEYERMEDVLDRCLRFINGVLSEFPSQEVVAVTHGDVIFTLNLWYRGLPLEYDNPKNVELYPVTGSVLRLTYFEKKRKPSVHYSNIL